MRQFGRKTHVFLRTIAFLARLLLGCLFLYSGCQKVLRPYSFLLSVYQFELIGPWLGLLVAAILPWVEVLFGLSLITGLFRRGSLLGVCLLCALFVVIQISAVMRGLTIGCGCFGPDSESLVGLNSIARTAVIMLAAVAAYCWSLRRAPDSPFPA